MVCGTYQLVKQHDEGGGVEQEEEEEGAEEDTRKGSLLLYRLVNGKDGKEEEGKEGGREPGGRRLVHVQTVEVGAGVLDCKWRPPCFSSSFSSSSSSSFFASSPILACALSTGEIATYALQHRLSDKEEEEEEEEEEDE